MEANTVMVIPETLKCVMLMIGNFSHLLRLSFDFFSGSHLVQLMDPALVLTVPSGHLIHSQHHGEVISLLVPGKHSNEQEDNGVKGVLHRSLDKSTLSLGVFFWFQAPTRIFLRPPSVVESSWKFIKFYVVESCYRITRLVKSHLASAVVKTNIAEIFL